MRVSEGFKRTLASEIGRLVEQGQAVTRQIIKAILKNKRLLGSGFEIKPGGGTIRMATMSLRKKGLQVDAVDVYRALVEMEKRGHFEQSGSWGRSKTYVWKR